MKTYFYYTSKEHSLLRERIKIRRFIDFLFENECIPLDHINYIFCDDDFLLQINQSFLKHNTYTDIITFNLSEEHKSIKGEVYISMDRIKENAILFGVTVKEEILRVVIHGALHLCGYKDKKKTDIQIMRSKENKYISLFVTFK